METISPSIEATLEFHILSFASRYTNTLNLPLLPAEQRSYFNNPFIASNSGGGAIYTFFGLREGRSLGAWPQALERLCPTTHSAAS